MSTTKSIPNVTIHSVQTNENFKESPNDDNNDIVTLSQNTNKLDRIEKAENKTQASGNARNHAFKKSLMKHITFRIKDYVIDRVLSDNTEKLINNLIFIRKIEDEDVKILQSFLLHTYFAKTLQKNLLEIVIILFFNDNIQ